MKFPQKFLLPAGVLIALILIAVFVVPFILNVPINENNSKINYACNTDSDCIVKTTGYHGEGVCNSPIKRCTNANSPEYTRQYEFPNILAICPALGMVNPNSCKCENNICTSYAPGPRGEPIKLK